MDEPKPYPHLVRLAAIEQAEATFSHPWNPASQITGTHLSALGGLKRTGVSLARIAPGKESFWAARITRPRSPTSRSSIDAWSSWRAR